MATYLVTGGAGFIGSHVVEELVRRGESVRVLDSLSRGHEENLAALRDRIQFHKLDIRDLDGMRSAFRGVDHVVHEAAFSSVPRSIAGPATCNSINVDGTLNVLIAARDAGVKRRVFAASAAVYGNSPLLPRTETQEPQPRSRYGLTKLVSSLRREGYARISADSASRIVAEIGEANNQARK